MITRRDRRPCPVGPGFTLVEILVVLVVIGLLTSISLTVAFRAISSGKVRATENTLKAVDQLITEYTAETGGRVPTHYTDAQGNAFPLVDGVKIDSPGEGILQPSLSLFLLEAGKARVADRMLQAIDAQFITRGFVPALGWPAADSNIALLGTDAPVVLDGFGNPLRLVHPSFHGGSGTYYLSDATGDYVAEKPRPSLMVSAPVTPLRPRPNPAEFSRSCLPLPLMLDTQPYPEGHADEGRCVGVRPYVYSMGLDGNAGTRVDNLYVTGRPQWPAETATIFPVVP